MTETGEGDRFYAPLVQQLPGAEWFDPRLIADATAKLLDPNTDAKGRTKARGVLKKVRAKATSVLRADRKMLAHGRDSRNRLGNYSPEAWEVIYELTMRTRPKALDDKIGIKDENIRRERATLARIEKERPDLTTNRSKAKEAARRLGRKSHRVIETRMPKK